MSEIIVETPDHSVSTALLPGSQVAGALRTTKARYDELSRDPRLAHLTIRKQQGEGAGALLEHPHWQLAGTGAVPAQVSSWLQHARRYYGRFGACVMCVLLQEELQAQTRIVLAGEHFVALEPYASASPFCTHIYPRRHMANFGEASNGEISDFAAVVHEVFARFCHGLADPGFTCALRTAPVADTGAKFYHWCLSIVPRLPMTGEGPRENERFVNPLLPEAAAEFLRAVRVKQAISA